MWSSPSALTWWTALNGRRPPKFGVWQRYLWQRLLRRCRVITSPSPSHISASNGVTYGGGGALIVSERGEEEIRVATGSLTSSYRAELVAIRAAMQKVFV
jgi:hypothetical protein